MTPILARLVALTEEAEAALGGRREVPVTRLPFRVGRDRRQSSDGDVAVERRGEAEPAENDLYLRETNGGQSLHISGAHFEIERADEGFVLVDRGSACGTIVAGRRIGGHRRGGQTPLRDGDEVVVGTSRSRYIFRFTVDDPGELGHA